MGKQPTAVKDMKVEKEGIELEEIFSDRIEMFRRNFIPSLCHNVHLSRMGSGTEGEAMWSTHLLETTHMKTVSYPPHQVPIMPETE